jgi:hypothetical protein
MFLMLYHVSLKSLRKESPMGKTFKYFKEVKCANKMAILFYGRRKGGGREAKPQKKNLLSSPPPFFSSQHQPTKSSASFPFHVTN